MVGTANIVEPAIGDASGGAALSRTALSGAVADDIALIIAD
jgi:hypothetical protein